MKIWLNNLKPGDIFYDNDSLRVHYYKVISNVINSYFKMPSFKVIDLNTNIETELFVNHYVYDNYNECKTNLLETLNIKLKNANENLLAAQHTYEYIKYLIQKIENEQENNE